MFMAYFAQIIKKIKIIKIIKKVRQSIFLDTLIFTFFLALIRTCW